MRKHLSRILVAGTAALAVAGAPDAQARQLQWPIYLICQPGVDQLRTRPFNDGGVVTAYIEVNTGVFKVGYRLRNGHSVFRQQQYTQTQGPALGTGTGWEGWRIDNPNLRMQGVLTYDESDQAHFTYQEQLWDRGNLILHTQAECLRVYDFASGAQYPRTAYYSPPPRPAYRPPSYAPPAPEPRRYADSVPIYTIGNRTAMVDVQVGSQTLRMTIDTGASIMSVPSYVAQRLVENGEADWGPDAEIGMADGRGVTSSTIVIHNVRLGNHSLRNIEAVITESADAMSLLPFGVLNMVGKFTIDSAAGELVFG
jgi:hypothetical protein